MVNGHPKNQSLHFLLLLLSEHALFEFDATVEKGGGKVCLFGVQLAFFTVVFRIVIKKGQLFVDHFLLFSNVLVDVLGNAFLVLLDE